MPSLKVSLPTKCQYIFIIEQGDFENVHNCLNTNIYTYLETSGGQSYNPC